MPILNIVVCAYTGHESWRPFRTLRLAPTLDMGLAPIQDIGLALLLNMGLAFTLNIEVDELG